MKELNEYIAIIGMSIKVPGANNIHEFWQNVTRGICSISTFDRSETAEKLPQEDVMSSNYILSRGVLDHIDQFDHQLFGMSHGEASLIDPQNRLFLQACYDALQDGGYGAKSARNNVALFATKANSRYLQRNLDFDPCNPEAAYNVQLAIGNEVDSLATFVANKLNLTGPSLTIETFCSSSLVCTHMGVSSLLNYESDMALAGGVFIEVPQERGYYHEAGSFTSPDGTCRAFDDRAAGTPFGNGLGVVLLKRLDDAIRDNDRVYSVICGSAVNNDGSDKAGFTTPSVIGQASVISEALSFSEVDPSFIGYVEAHGTGTNIGDPIEIEALTRAYRAYTDKNQYVFIGSVKPNIGHLDRASGVVGVIKATLAIYHHAIPPSIHYEMPNRHIDFEQSPFKVSTSVEEWPNLGKSERYAAVSAFGLGGTNAHLILSNYHASIRHASSDDKYYMVPLSSNTEDGLQKQVEALTNTISVNHELSISDIAYSYFRCREQYKYRVGIIVKTLPELRDCLVNTNGPNLVYGRYQDKRRKVVFLFPGTGEQLLGQAYDLYFTEPVFKHAVDECFKILEPVMNLDVKQVLYPDQVKEAHDPKAIYEHSDMDFASMFSERFLDEEQPYEPIQNTYLSHPVLFSIQYALVKLWNSYGVEADIYAGYSLGEYLAAHFAGVFTLEDVLYLVANRAKLIQSLDEGRMLSIQLPAEELTPFLSDKLSIAAFNAQDLTVVSGDFNSIKTLKAQLNKKGVVCKSLNAIHPFHSDSLRQLEEPVKALFENVQISVPSKPWMSNLTGKPHDMSQTVTVQYWIDQMCSPILFQDIMQYLLEQGGLCIEMGTGALQMIAYANKNHSGQHEDTEIITSLPSPYEKCPDQYAFQKALAQVWGGGLDIKWDVAFNQQTSNIVEIPGYVFEAASCWQQKTLSAGNIVFSEGRQDIQFFSPTLLPSVQTEPTSLDVSECAFLFINAAKTVFPKPLVDKLSPMVKETRLISIGHELDDILTKNAHQGAIYAVYYYASQKNARPLKALAGFQAVVQKLMMARGTCVSHVTLVVDADESLHGAYSFLDSYVKSISLETSDYKFKTVFCSIGKKPSEPYVNAVANELVYIRKTGEAIYYDGYSRLQKQYLPVGSIEKNPIYVSRYAKSPYLIVGGLGSIGLLLCQHILSSQPEATAILTTSKPDRMSAALPTELMSVSDRVSVELLDPLNLEHFTSITGRDYAGIFYLCAYIEDRLVVTQTAEGMKKVFNVKYQGAKNLLSLSDQYHTDFIVLFSSLAALTGNTGQADYAAANAAMDSLVDGYARSLSKQGCFVTSINWHVWKEAGFAARMVSNPGQGSEQFREIFDTGLTNEEALSALDKIISSRLAAHIVVGRQTPDEVRQLLASGVAHPDKKLPVLSGDLDDESKQLVTRAVDKIWKDILGLDDIDPDDHFIHLGGHSLAAIRLSKRIQDDLGFDCALTTIFQYPTINKLAQHLCQLLCDEVRTSDVESVSNDHAESSELDRTQTTVLQELGRDVTFLNKAEFEHFYDDIFVKKTYVKHGITLPANACVFDVGANIGLFTLFTVSNWPQASVFSFEPAPEVFEVCKLNVKGNQNVTLYNKGLSDRERMLELNYLPYSTGMSSFYEIDQEEENLLSTLIENQRETLMANNDFDDVMDNLDLLTEQRMESKSIVAHLTTLSSIIDEHAIEHIDLVKIDVQKSEFDVLLGIQSEHWPRIRQLVVEVHDHDNRVTKMKLFLEDRGYTVVSEQDSLYKSSEIFMLYAIKKRSEFYEN